MLMKVTKISVSNFILFLHSFRFWTNRIDHIWPKNIEHFLRISPRNFSLRVCSSLFHSKFAKFNGVLPVTTSYCSSMHNYYPNFNGTQTMFVSEAQWFIFNNNLMLFKWKLTHELPISYSYLPTTTSLNII